MQFYAPKAFVYLWVLPALILLFRISRGLWMRRVRKIGDPDTVLKKLLPQYRLSHWSVRVFYLLAVFAFAILALARPQWGEEKKRIQRKGVDVIIMMDTSLSMLAEDIKPSRFQKAKLEIRTLVRNFNGDRVGMVAFAGSSFLQSPLTLDYAAFYLFLDAIDVGYIPDPGTSLDRALRRAANSFPESDTKHKAVILFTDGEDHEGGLEGALKEVAEKGVRVYPIGLGSEEGEPIPLKDDKGRRMGYKKDRSGQVVITRLNREVLEQIAKATGGIYLPATPGEQEIDLILKHMETLGERTFKERMIADKEDHFQLFLSLALIFLVLETLVSTVGKPPPAAVALLAVFILFSGFMESPRDLNEKGNALFQEKKYESALEQYRKAQVKEPDDPAVLYNLASALYQVQDYQEAKNTLEKAVKHIEDKQLKQKALYNYGNTLYRLGDFEKSIEAYKGALELNPEDEDAKYNLEFLQKSKNKFEKENQDKQKDSQKQQDQKQQQQQNQQQQQQQQQQKKDQQKQDQQQPQDQDQKDQQKQDQQNQDQKDQQKPEDQKDQQGQGGDQEEDQNQKPDKDQEEQDQGQKPKDEGQEQPAKPEEGEGDAPQQPKEEEQPQPEPGEGEPQPQGGEEQQEQQMPQPQEGSQQKTPLQGQMKMENALQILDALKEGEKDMQDLRRPPAERKDVPVLKDW